MKPTKKDIEAMAAALHEAVKGYDFGPDHDPWSRFQKLSEKKRAAYLHAARELLENPPPVLKRYASRRVATLSSRPGA